MGSSPLSPTNYAAMVLTVSIFACQAKGVGSNPISRSNKVQWDTLKSCNFSKMLYEMRNSVLSSVMRDKRKKPSLDFWKRLNTGMTVLVITAWTRILWVCSKIGKAPDS